MVAGLSVSTRVVDMKPVGCSDGILVEAIMATAPIGGSLAPKGTWEGSSDD